MVLHRHHKVPTHAGGTNDKSNIELLTIEEHAEAHRKLYELHGRWQDRIAWLGLTGMIGKEELIRQVHINIMLGKKHSEETRKKMSASRRLRKHSDDTKRKMGDSRTGDKNPMFGKVFSDIHRRRLSDSRKGAIFSDTWKQKISSSKKGKMWMFNPLTKKASVHSTEEINSLLAQGWNKGRK